MVIGATRTVLRWLLSSSGDTTAQGRVFWISRVRHLHRFLVAHAGECRFLHRVEPRTADPHQVVLDPLENLGDALVTVEELRGLFECVRRTEEAVVGMGLERQAVVVAVQEPQDVRLVGCAETVFT